MKVDLNNPIVYHKPISFEQNELKESRIINEIARKHLRKIVDAKEKKKIAIIDFFNLYLVSNKVAKIYCKGK